MRRAPTTEVRARSRISAIAVALAAGAAVGGCAHQAGAIAGEVAEEMPEPLIQESLRTLSDEETRDLIARVLGMPEVRDATRELVGNVTDGMIDAMTDEERAARLAELAERFVARVGDTLADVMERDVAPVLAQTMSRALDASLRTLLSERSTDRIGEAIARLAREAAAAMALALREEIGPALRATLREDLAPALREALADPDVQGAIADTSRTMSRGVVLGIQDALEQIEERRGPEQTSTLLTRLQGLPSTSATFQYVAAGLALLLLLAIALLARAVARARAHEAEAQRREAAMIALAEAIKSAEDRPWSSELLDMLRQSLRDTEHGAYVRDVLRRHRGLRAERAREGHEIDREERGPRGPLEPSGA